MRNSIIKIDILVDDQIKYNQWRDQYLIQFTLTGTATSN